MTDIRQCRAFIAVAEELNFHRAAEKLGTVQPALSRIIRNLERDLNVILLERTTRHVSLTEPGKVFLDEARSLVSHLSDAVRTARAVQSGSAGSLTLAYMDFAVHDLLPQLVSAVARSGAQVRFELKYMPTSQQKLALLEGRIDLGIMIGPMSSPMVDGVKLADAPLIIVLPEKHALCARRKLKVSDIRDESLLLGTAAEWTAFRDEIFRVYAEHGASPHITIEASSAAALFGLAAKGLGITLYAGRPKLYENAGLAFRSLTPAVNLPIHLVWRKGAKLHLVRHALKLAGLLS